MNQSDTMFFASSKVLFEAPEGECDISLTGNMMQMIKQPSDLSILLVCESGDRSP